MSKDNLITNDAFKQGMDEAKQNAKDHKQLVESTEEMIDMHFTEFAEFLEGKNVGELRAFRSLLQMHLDKTDMYAKKLVDAQVIVFNKKERVQMGSVFGLVNKIVDRMGYVDYLIKKNSIG